MPVLFKSLKHNENLSVYFYSTEIYMYQVLKTIYKHVHWIILHIFSKNELIFFFYLLFFTQCIALCYKDLNTSEIYK